MKTKTSSQGPMQERAAYLKRKMRMSRMIGIMCCLLAIAAIVTYYLKTMNEWISVIIIAYSAATIFTANSFIQDIRVGNPWQRVNAVCAILIYLLTVFLIVWGFVYGELTAQF